jgi:hypothetical protein
LTDVPAEATHGDGPDLDAWDAWSPEEAATRLDPTGIEWCVVGGWSIDLFLRTVGAVAPGGVSRAHGDLEIEILEADLPIVREALADLVFHAVGDGRVYALAHDEAPPVGTHQTWVLDPAASAWRIDVMRVAGDAATWRCRRDDAIAEPRSFMVDRTAEGIPYLAPHGTLLYKAKATRPKDEADFEACLPLLGTDRRTWLHDALERVHPGHAWITRLR